MAYTIVLVAVEHSTAISAGLAQLLGRIVAGNPGGYRIDLPSIVGPTISNRSTIKQVLGVGKALLPGTSSAAAVG